MNIPAFGISGMQFSSQQIHVTRKIRQAQEHLPKDSSDGLLGLTPREQAKADTWDPLPATVSVEDPHPERESKTGWEIKHMCVTTIVLACYVAISLALFYGLLAIQSLRDDQKPLWTAYVTDSQEAIVRTLRRFYSSLNAAALSIFPTSFHRLTFTSALVLLQSLLLIPELAVTFANWQAMIVRIENTFFRIRQLWNKSPAMGEKRVYWTCVCLPKPLGQRFWIDVYP